MPCQKERERERRTKEKQETKKSVATDRKDRGDRLAGTDGTEAGQQAPRQRCQHRKKRSRNPQTQVK